MNAQHRAILFALACALVSPCVFASSGSGTARSTACDQAIRKAPKDCSYMGYPEKVKSIGECQCDKDEKQLDSWTCSVRVECKDGDGHPAPLATLIQQGIKRNAAAAPAPI